MQTSDFRLQTSGFRKKLQIPTLKPEARSPKSDLQSEVQTAVIGDFQRNDFHQVIRDIRRNTVAIYFDNLALFWRANGLGQNYDLIFLLESSFLQYSHRDIQRLQARWPLARIVMVAGSLAEGERRTGWLPAELIRYYWHQWETEALPALTAFCDHRPSSWGLPLTASEEERLLSCILA